MKKGLRQSREPGARHPRAFKPCPDEEGIKTTGVRHYPNPPIFKPCPDEEGIKTITNVGLVKGPVDLNLALMKKGLRQVMPPMSTSVSYLNLALMKKGLRLLVATPNPIVIRFKPCPDEEGIKT